MGTKFEEWRTSSAEDSEDDDEAEDKHILLALVVEEAVDRSSNEDLRVFNFLTIRLGVFVVFISPDF